MDTNIILSIAAVVGGLSVIFGGLFAVYKIARKIDDAIGVDKDGKTVSERIARVEHQLWENGGSSLADRVNKIEANTIETATEVRFIKELIVSGAVTVQAAQPVARVTRKRKAS